MAKITTVKSGQGFAYDASPQGSPQWIALRTGKVTASRLTDWLAVSKKDGKPLKARKDYENEIAFEKQFGVPFARFTTRAMEEGTEAEPMLALEYFKQTGNEVEECGAFYNDLFVASPDRLSGEDGLVELKWLYDTNFAEVLSNGVKSDHYLQIQGQLWASGRKWCDYVVGNGNTGKFKVIRVERDKEVIKQIKDSLVGLDKIEQVFSTDGLYDISKIIPYEETGDGEKIW